MNEFRRDADWTSRSFSSSRCRKNIWEGEITIHAPGGGCCSLRACDCALPLRPFMRGQSGGWGRKSPWCLLLLLLLLSDAADVVVREYSAASGGARHSSTFSQKGCVSSSRRDFLTAPDGADTVLRTVHARTHAHTLLAGEPCACWEDSNQRFR